MPSFPPTASTADLFNHTNTKGGKRMREKANDRAEKDILMCTPPPLLIPSATCNTVPHHYPSTLRWADKRMCQKQCLPTHQRETYMYLDPELSAVVKKNNLCLAFTTLWANSADNKLIFLFFPENRL